MANPIPKPRPTPDPRWRKLRKAVEIRIAYYALMENRTKFGDGVMTGLQLVQHDIKRLTREAKKRGGA